MSYTLLLVVRDGAKFHTIDARIILKHPNRLFLESLLEVQNGFIRRVEQSTRALYEQTVLVTFQVKPLTVNNGV